MIMKGVSSAMKNLKSDVMVVLIVALCISALLSGCALSGVKNRPADREREADPTISSAKQTAGETSLLSPDERWVLGSEPLHIEVYGHYDWWAPKKWKETVLGDWIANHKQVSLSVIPAGVNPGLKLNSMMASNELPHMIWMDRNYDVRRLYDADMLVPFDDYLEKYTNLKQWAGEEALNLLRFDDGKLYQFPNWYSKKPYGNAGYVVNKKIYEELGSPKLETTEDLYDYLKKVKEKYGSTVVPFEPHLARDGQGLAILYTAFEEGAMYYYLSSQMRAVPKGDQLTSIFTDPVFREAQKYIAKLYREQLIAQDAMTQTLDQITEKVMQGRVAVMASAEPMKIAAAADEALRKNDPAAGYFMIWPLHKPGLDKHKIYPGNFTSIGWNVSVITKAAPDPEKIFAFLDWYTGPEGQVLQFFGPDGLYYDGLDEHGVPRFNQKYNPEHVAQMQLEHDPWMFAGNTMYIDPVKANFEETLPEEDRTWQLTWQSKITWKTQANANEFINLNPAPNSEEGIIRQSVDDIYLTAVAKLLNAKDDAEVDQILDHAEADAQAAGYAKLLQWQTAKWHENKRIMEGSFGDERDV